MNKQESLEELYKTLVESLHSAHHNFFIDKTKKAQVFLELADRTIEAINLLEDDKSWQCRDAHCIFKHNSRSTHE